MASTQTEFPSFDGANLHGLRAFEREEFVTERFHYDLGEHVTFLAPTQNGKTTLKFQLLQHVISPKRPAVILIMKPRDRVPEQWAKKLKLQIVRDWPPPIVKRKLTNPPGWMVWPKHTFKPREDNAHLANVFERAINGAYKKGNRILDVDELYGVTDELGLDDELIAVWSRGASMGCGLWGGSQRPANVPLYAYSQAQHLFLGHISDARDRKRFGEISGKGVNRDLIEEIVDSLDEHEWLYIRRKSSRAEMCRVLAA